MIQGPGAPPATVVRSFVAKFTQIFESHGGFIDAHPQFGKDPWMGPVNLGDGGEMSKSYCPPAPRFLLLTACSREGLDPDWQSLRTDTFFHDVRRPRPQR